MVSISSAIETIISRSRYLSEAISKGIINTSALARYIKPEVEEMTQKKVSEAALVMALNRLSGTIKPKYKSSDIFVSSPDMIVRSNLAEVNILNSESLIEKLPKILTLTNSQSKHFLTITYGIFETTILVSLDLKNKLLSLLEEETIVSKIDGLSAVTIKLPQEAIKAPGIYYFFLKSLAWEGINIVEIVSAHLELTLIFDEKDVNNAFSILQSLFIRK